MAETMIKAEENEKRFAIRSQCHERGINETRNDIANLRAVLLYKAGLKISLS